MRSDQQHTMQAVLIVSHQYTERFDEKKPAAVLDIFPEEGYIMCQHRDNCLHSVESGDDLLMYLSWLNYHNRSITLSNFYQVYKGNMTFSDDALSRYAKQYFSVLAENGHPNHYPVAMALIHFTY